MRRIYSNHFNLVFYALRISYFPGIVAKFLSELYKWQTTNSRCLLCKSRCRCCIYTHISTILDRWTIHAGGNITISLLLQWNLTREILSLLPHVKIKLKSNTWMFVNYSINAPNLLSLLSPNLVLLSQLSPLKKIPCNYS